MYIRCMSCWHWFHVAFNRHAIIQNICSDDYLTMHSTIERGLQKHEIWAQYGPHQAWLTFGHAPRNCSGFLVSAWLISFCAIEDKPPMGLRSDVVNKLIGAACSKIWWANSLCASLSQINFCDVSVNPSSDSPDSDLTPACIHGFRVIRIMQMC